MRRPLPSSLVAMATAVAAACCAAAVALPSGPARAAAPAPAIAILGEDAAAVDALRPLVPEGAVLRDVATFRTERGEPAALLLWVTEAQPIADAPFDVDTCPGAVAGQALTGVYHLGLAISGALANAVTLPTPDAADPTLQLPVANTTLHNWEHWGQGKRVAWDAPGADVVAPTKLLRLADYTGDGRAFEVRVVAFVAACGHLETLLAGYSPTRRAVLVFPIVAGDVTSAWHDNLFGNPAEKHATRLTWRWACGDHGADTDERQTFRFDAKAEIWRQVSATSRPCPR